MSSPPRRGRRAVVLIAGSTIVIIVAAIAYLQTGPALPRFTGGTARLASPSATPTPTRPPWNLPCPPTELTLTGIFNECASIDHGMSCPTGSFNQARILRIHGSKDDFILYIEVNGAYRGPGTYALAPWPNATLGVPDGVAKVAIREWSSGNIWESSAGSLTIDNSEESGWVYAGLGASTYSSVDVQLNVAGWWSCS